MADESVQQVPAPSPGRVIPEAVRPSGWSHPTAGRDRRRKLAVDGSVPRGHDAAPALEASLAPPCGRARTTPTYGAGGRPQRSASSCTSPSPRPGSGVVVHDRRGLEAVTVVADLDAREGGRDAPEQLDDAVARVRVLDAVADESA